MQLDNEHVKDKDKLSLWLSLFIALCVIVLFCAISVAIAKNVNEIAHSQNTQYFSLPSLEDQENNNVLL